MVRSGPLDVYKRQPNLLTYPMAAQGAFEDVSAAMEKLGRSRDDYQPSVQSLMDIDGAWSVSYTHLDVYKRQERDRPCDTAWL